MPNDAWARGACVQRQRVAVSTFSQYRRSEPRRTQQGHRRHTGSFLQMITLERHRKIVTGSTQTLTAARRSSDKGAWQLIQFGHKSASLVANQLTCRERVQVNSQNSGSAEVVGSTGMRMVMVMRMSIPLTSRSSFLWIDSIDNVVRPGLNQQQFLCTVTTDWETIRFWIVWFSAASSLQ